MFRKRYLWVPVVGLILIGLLVAGGLVVDRMAWSRGYAMGQVAGVEEAEVPDAPRAFGFGFPDRYYRHSPLGFGLGLVVELFLVVLALGFFCKLCGFGAWALMGAPRWHVGRARRRPRRWHPRHGFPPYWYWGWEESDDAEAREAEPAENEDVDQRES